MRVNVDEAGCHEAAGDIDRFASAYGREVSYGDDAPILDGYIRLPTRGASTIQYTTVQQEYVIHGHVQ